MRELGSEGAMKCETSEQMFVSDVADPCNVAGEIEVVIN